MKKQFAKIFKTRFFWAAILLALSAFIIITNLPRHYCGNENIVFKANHQSLAELMRHLRLANPYVKNSFNYKVWNEQAQFNVPIIILSALYLDEYCQSHNKRFLLFSARDCCHLIEIFKKLFPRYESTYFYSSRLVYQNPSPPYLDYVKSLYNDQSVIVDGQGTGKSCRTFFSKYFNIDPCYIPLVGSDLNKPAIVHFTHRSKDKIEMLNYASHGSLFGFTEKGPLFLPLEYDAKNVEAAYSCIEKCIELMDTYKFGPFDQTLINSLLKKLKSTTPVMKKYHSINHK